MFSDYLLPVAENIHRARVMAIMGNLGRKSERPRLIQTGLDTEIGGKTW